jgi:uncharacterized glyoxalase superfamily protein PhnB
MSAETPTLYPVFRYRNAKAAIEFLKSAFGFREVVVFANPDDTIAHAELSYGPGILMLGTEKKDDPNGKPAGQAALYVAVDDADAHHARARAAGAEVISELHDTEYDSREYAVRDTEGNVWHFGTYRPAVDRKMEETVPAAAR